MIKLTLTLAVSCDMQTSMALNTSLHSTGTGVDTSIMAQGTETILVVKKPYLFHYF